MMKYYSNENILPESQKHNIGQKEVSLYERNHTVCTF